MFSVGFTWALNFMPVLVESLVIDSDCLRNAFVGFR
jgi:hypothetical protein